MNLWKSAKDNYEKLNSITKVKVCVIGKCFLEI